MTFLDNHDTGSTQAHWPFPAQHLHQARLGSILSQPARTKFASTHMFEPLVRIAGFSSVMSVQGYAYILTHPGTPCVFLDHLWTDGMLKPSLWRRLRSLLQVQTMLSCQRAPPTVHLYPITAGRCL